jgi:multidrug efflux pump subunit AcrA (membrane-fusion protein)
LRVPTAQAIAFKVKQNVSVRFPNLNFTPVNSTIHTISPVTDAGSDTVKIDILLSNPKGELRSGVKCLVTVQ